MDSTKDNLIQENPFFSEIKGRFGFGCMRLPMKKGAVDTEETSRMVDLFLQSGLNYFDTAHGYLEGKSETALKECLTSRYPREKYLLADKLTHGLFTQTPEGVREFFRMQLDACGVEYFDFYLMHSQNEKYFSDFKACKAYETALELKAEGKIRHVGLSFHDKAEVLDRILTEYPQMEFVQIQLNYIDFDDPGVQSGLCYEVCRKHGKPVIVMEPVKGGNLAHLPEDCAAILEGLGEGSQASYALRYAASFPEVMMVLSGMTHLPQMEENLSFMTAPAPITETEAEALDKVKETFRSKRLIACTACRYCTEGCPMEIPIPDLFADLNSKSLHKDWNSNWYFMVHTQGKGKPSDCIECGQCEGVCPQHLPIIETLKKVAEIFEKN
ncbi:MAG: aldo/keto reductase [Bacteroidales bacterium]|nr:aldo/keto reductase [Bacteroidales bacterium]